MPDYFQLLNKSNQNTQQLRSGDSGGSGNSTTVSAGGGGTDYFSLLSTGKRQAPVEVAPQSPNLLDQAGGLVTKGVSFVKDYFQKKDETIKKYQPVQGTKGIFQTVFEGSVVPVLDRQKFNIETKMKEPGVTNDFDSRQLQMVDKFLQMTPDERWNNRNVIKFFVNDIKTDRNIKSAYTGVISTVNSLLDGSAWLAGKSKNVKILNPISSKVENVLNKGSDNLDAWLKVLAPENQTFAEKISSGAGSSLPFFAIGAGFGKGAQFLSKVSPRIAAWFGGSAAGATEAMSEAGSVYDENIKKGKDKKEADKAANKVFGANIVLNILTDRFGVFSEDKIGLKKFILSTSGEGIQEATQQVISNVNTNRPWDEGVFESGVIGSIIGSGMGTVGTDVKTDTQVADEMEADKAGGGGVPELKLPENIEPAVAQKIQELNVQDVSNPVQGEDTVRVYQAEGVGDAGKSNWVFKTPEALADYLNNGDPNATVRFIDVKSTDLVAHPERSPDVFTIKENAVEPVAETVTEKRQQKKTSAIKKEEVKSPPVRKEYPAGTAFGDATSWLDNEINSGFGLEEMHRTRPSKYAQNLFRSTKPSKPITLYRAGRFDDSGRLYSSWTKDPKVAREFSRILRDMGQKDTIYKQTFKPDDILVDTDSLPQEVRDNIGTGAEQEVIVKTSPRMKENLKTIEFKKKEKTKKRPLSTIKEEKQDVSQQLEQKKTEAVGVAEVAKDKRQGLNTKDIGNLKRIYFKSQKFQEGDIETIRASNSGKLLDRVIEDVQIKFPGMTEEEAFDYAMTLPVKSDESVKRLPEIADLKGKLKQIESEYDAYVKKNGLAVGVRKKAIKNGLRMSFGDMPEYEMVNIDEQTDEALKLLVADKTYALDIALGKVDPPPGLLPESVFIAVENDALSRGDTDVLRQLATESALVSDATAMGQRIRMLAERNPYSPTSAMDKVAKVRKLNIEEKTGKKVSQLTKETVSDIQSEITKAQPKKSEWGLFIDSITCK